MDVFCRSFGSARIRHIAHGNAQACANACASEHRADKMGTGKMICRQGNIAGILDVHILEEGIGGAIQQSHTRSRIDSGPLTGKGSAGSKGTYALTRFGFDIDIIGIQIVFSGGANQGGFRGAGNLIGVRTKAHSAPFHGDVHRTHAPCTIGIVVGNDIHIALIGGSIIYLGIRNASLGGAANQVHIHRAIYGRTCTRAAGIHQEGFHGMGAGGIHQ